MNLERSRVRFSGLSRNYVATVIRVKRDSFPVRARRYRHCKRIACLYIFVQNIDFPGARLQWEHCRKLCVNSSDIRAYCNGQ